MEVCLVILETGDKKWKKIINLKKLFDIFIFRISKE